MKFKVLEMNQKLFAWLGIEANNETAFFKSIYTYYIIINSVIVLTSSFMVITSIDKSQFEVALDLAVLMIAVFQYGGMFISTGMEKETITFLDRTLQEIVDQGCYFHEFPIKTTKIILNL